jgi:hypothetical protein
METNEEAYAAGFAAFCKEAGIDPDELLKFAKVMHQAPTTAEKAQFKAKVTGKPAPQPKGIKRLTSSGTTGSKGEIAKKHQLKRELLGD